METDGKRLRRLRKAAGLTAAALGRSAGVTESAVRNQENGTNGIPVGAARDYAVALGVSPAVILFGDIFQTADPVSPPETIVAAAHLYRCEGSDDPRAVPCVVSAPPPARHHNLFALAGHCDESGFLTSTGRFVNRREALQIAIASGQPLIDHPSRHDTMLFSEDLW